jgi:ribosomal-protein-alanine N-acetyltransferase
VRPAEPADAAELAALHAAAFPAGEAWGEVALRRMLDLPGSWALLLPGRGFVLARLAAGEGEILTLAVTPKARRQGVARALLQACLVQAMALGAEAMFLEVAEANTAARGLYEGCGFSGRARRRGYYGPGRDALLLALDLRKTSRP